MPITSAQLAMRRKHIGSSDCAAILGLSPWSDAQKVFWDKRPDLVSPDFVESRKETPAIEAGNVLEDAIIGYASRNLNVGVRKNQFRVSKGPDGGILSATVDALVEDRPEAIEAKTTGITYFASRDALDEWGEPDTNEVPAHYLMQCHHQITVLDLERVWLYALIGGRGFVRYRVERNKEISDFLLETLPAWWTKHVVAGVAPDPTLPPPADLIRSIRPQSGKVIELDMAALAVIDEWERLKDLGKSVEAQMAAARAKVELLVGDAEQALLPDGRTVKRAFEERTHFDRKAFESEHPELASAFTSKRPNENPTLRLLKAKKGR